MDTPAVSSARAQSAAQTAAAANAKSKQTAPEQKAAATPKPRRKSMDDLHCVKYKPTGSHRTRTRCVTQAQRQLEEDAARNALDAATGPTFSGTP